MTKLWHKLDLDPAGALREDLDLSFVNGSAPQVTWVWGTYDDELKDILQQMHKGTNQGIDEALAELKDLEVLDDELTQGIEKSRNLIMQGIDKLTETLFPPTKKTPVDEEAGKATDNNESIGLSGIQKYSSDFSTSSDKSSDLTITTAEGDIVNITFSDIQKYQASEKYQQASTSDDYQKKPLILKN